MQANWVGEVGHYLANINQLHRKQEFNQKPSQPATGGRICAIR